MKKKFTVQILVAGALAAGMWGIAFAESSDRRAAIEPQEGQACTLETLRGSYLYAASGFNIVGGVAQPKAIHEAIEFNGDGTLTVPGVTLSVNGNVSHPPGASGDYAVEADCRGTLVFSSGQTYDIVVAPNGKMAWMFQTNLNTVFQGTATRLER
jgi:hypothetical protein